MTIQRTNGEWFERHIRWKQALHVARSRAVSNALKSAGAKSVSVNYHAAGSLSSSAYFDVVIGGISDRLPGRWRPHISYTIYRARWIKRRDIIVDVLKVVGFSIEHRCSMANKLMTRLGFDEPSVATRDKYARLS